MVGHMVVSGEKMFSILDPSLFNDRLEAIPVLVCPKYLAGDLLYEAELPRFEIVFRSV